MRQLLAGNWKMNGLHAALGEIRALNRAFGKGAPSADILICPPATLVAHAAKEAEGGPIAIGGQDCHDKPSGAFTGDISAEMLRDAGATYVILGHSERRQYHGETDATVATKAAAARRAALIPIICVGESEAERAVGRAADIVTAQLAAGVPQDATPDSLVIAYEPIWAIGTGRTPTPAEIAEIHADIRVRLTGRFGERGHGVRILYGGSVKPENAGSILRIRNVDGALIGGASLKAADMLLIAKAASGR
jgi:triosephosphate isomerase (TIM)